MKCRAVLSLIAVFFYSVASGASKAASITMTGGGKTLVISQDDSPAQQTENLFSVIDYSSSDMAGFGFLGVVDYSGSGLIVGLRLGTMQSMYGNTMYHLQNSKGQSILHAALDKKNDAVIDFLLKNQTSKNLLINEQDQQGFKPLHTALLHQNYHYVERLIAAGADVNALDNAGRTPLQLFLSIPSFFDAKNKSIEAPCFSAEHFAPLLRGNVDFAKSFLKSGGGVAHQVITILNIWDRCQTDDSAPLLDPVNAVLLSISSAIEFWKDLLQPAWMRHDRTIPSGVRLLLEDKRVPINLQDNNGDTVLHLAARYGMPEVLGILLAVHKHDVNHEIINNGGMTPEACAHKDNNLSCKALLAHFCKKKK